MSDSLPEAPPAAPVSAAEAARRHPRLRAWLLLAPMLLWLAAFVVAPTAILFVYSFCQRDEVGRVVYAFSLENYRRVADPVYLWIFGRSIFYAGLTTAICVALGFPVAYFIARAGETLRHRLLLLVMVPFWTSFLIRTYAWITILKQEGLLNGLLHQVAPAAQPWDLLYTPTAVVIGLVYAYLPFMILPIYGSAEKIEGAVIEAAYDLGAGPLRAFSSVI
ncbi:MAG TPA: ABC transporter permease, partial [Opitutaceae bacterium]|nr:ABC transporter permease [Opitutaceae bacterium]